MGGGGSSIALPSLTISAPNSSGQSTGASVKCVVVGDHGAGKSSLIITYVTGMFPSEPPNPTANDNHNVFLTADGNPVQLGIWDTVGTQDNDRLRPLSYANTEVFLICFSTADKTAGERVVKKWYPEIRFHSASASVVLVGLRTDERMPEGISEEAGRKLASKCGKCAHYVECSAKTNQNVKKVFDTAITVALSQHHGAARESGGDGKKMRKPVVYLYPEREMPVRVTVRLEEGSLTSVYPPAHNEVKEESTTPQREQQQTNAGEVRKEAGVEA